MANVVTETMPFGQPNQNQKLDGYFLPQDCKVGHNFPDYYPN